jgi:hypothetical protein
MMDNHLNELLVWFKVRWIVIGRYVSFRVGCGKKCCWWVVLLRSGNLTRQPAYLWNAESELYKIGMGWSAGSAVKRYKNNF